MARTVHDVAAAVLQFGSPMSAMKLQKLVYYSQAWHAVWDEERLFPESIEAWAGGPVVRELYNAHRGRFSVNDWPQGRTTNLSTNQLETIEAVVEGYGRFSGQQLSFLTHRERPWRDAREGLAPGERGSNEITLESMVDFYSGLEADPNAEAITLAVIPDL